MFPCSRRLTFRIGICKSPHQSDLPTRRTRLASPELAWRNRPFTVPHYCLFLIEFTEIAIGFDYLSNPTWVNFFGEQSQQKREFPSFQGPASFWCGPLVIAQSGLLVCFRLASFVCTPLLPQIHIVVTWLQRLLLLRMDSIIRWKVDLSCTFLFSLVVRR